MIQVLTYSGNEQAFLGEKVVVSSLHEPLSLDEFEINVICLKDERIWRNKGDSRTGINSTNNLISLSHMLKNCKKTQNVILLPQNVTYKFSNWGIQQHEEYHKSCELKDMLYEMNYYILDKLYEPIKGISMLYENTKTKVGEKEIAAAFYFYDGIDEALTFSAGSSKVTTAKKGEVWLSTLNLKNYQEMISFLKMIGLIKDKQDIPEWMEEVKMFDDNKQWKVIEENNQTIKIANDNISKAMEVINENNKYKSILYTNGDELVDVVFKILEKMLGCNLSEFVDEKGPDFVFELAEKVFIGEIKGVNHNVKNENISQLDYHCQCYLDDHEDVKAENIVPLLIINHQRNKPLAGREPVKETQESLAKKYGSLIVETITLLKLFEKYLNEEKTREECIDILKSNTGLLTV